MNLLGVTLPDAPEGLFETYPFGVIARAIVPSEGINGYVLAAFSSEAMIIPGALIGAPCDLIAAFNDGYALYLYNIDDSTDWELMESATDNTTFFPAGNVEEDGYVMNVSILWANHDIYGVDVNTENLDRTYLFMPQSTDVEEYSSMRTERVIVLAQHARRLSGGMEPMSAEAIAAAFSAVTSPVEGLDWILKAALNTANYCLYSDTPWVYWNYQVCTAKTNIKKLDFPNAKGIDYYAFAGITALEKVNFPELTDPGGYAFEDCSALKAVDFPKLASCSYGMIYGCTALERADLGLVTSIGNYAAYNCSALKTLILRNTASVCTIGTNAFTGCTGLKSGLIYVPEAMVASYQADAAWAALVTDAATQIVTLDRIDLSNAAQVDMKQGGANEIKVPYTYYGDGMTVTAVSNNTDLVTVGACTLRDGYIVVPVTSLAADGTATVTVTATSGTFTATKDCTVVVNNSLADPTYTVEGVTGVTYGFALNDEGYYESANTGVDRSVAMCKVTFNTQGWARVYIDCINFTGSEANNDYGSLSVVDGDVMSKYYHTADDPDNVFHSFAGVSSADVQTVDYGYFPAGEHFIYIKYVKNYSTNAENDSLQFKVRMG